MIRQSPQHGVRGPWFQACLGLWDSLPENHQATIAALIAETIGQPDAAQTRQCLDALSPEQRDRLLQFQEVVAALRDLSPGYESQYGTDAKAQRLELLNRFSPKELVNVLLELVNQDRDWDVEGAAETLVNMLRNEQIRPSRYSRSARLLLERFVRGAIPRRSQVLIVIADAAADFPATLRAGAFANLVSDLCVELLKYEPHQGANTLVRLGPILPDELKATIADEMADDLAAAERSTASLAEYATRIEILASYANSLTNGTVSKLSSFALRAIGPGKGDDDIRVALDLLRRVPAVAVGPRIKTSLTRLKGHSEFAEVVEQLLGPAK
jgi:hypothetical protein